MQEVVFKAIVLVLGLVIGYVVVRGRKGLQGTISSAVYRWLLPYVIFVEVSSITLTPYWWGYSLIGAAFVLVPFFVGQVLFRLTKHRAVLVATAEGGTVGFALYATIGTAPLYQFFLVDMIGNGLSVFLIIFPILMQGRREWGSVFNRLTIAMIGGMLANFAGFHPLLYEFVSTPEPWLVVLLILLIAMVVGSSVVIKISREILSSWFFAGFWVYRAALFLSALYMNWPLAVTILAILPPSFLLPVFYRAQKFDGEFAVYASNFIASCLPVTMVLAAYLIAR